MSVDRGFSGWEGGQHDAFTGAVSGQADILGHDTLRGSPRTGDFFLDCYQPTGSSSTTVRFRSPTISAALLDGESLVAKGRIYLRVGLAPGVAGMVLYFGNSSYQMRTGVELNPDLTMTARASTTLGTASAWSLSLNTWYRVDLTGTWTNLPASSNYQVDTTCSVYTEAGVLVGTVTATVTMSGAFFSYASIQAGCGFLPAAGGTTFHVAFDDFVWDMGTAGDAAGVAFRTATRVTAFPATAQGSGADWTGDYRFTTQRPRQTTVANAEQTTSTNGHTTTFTHATAASKGVSGIEGVVCHAYAKAASSGADAILINGTEYSVTTQTTYPVTTGGLMALDGTAYSTAAFDTLEFGFRNKRGVSTQLGKCLLEVLHAGTDDPIFDLLNGVESWKHQWVTYSGNSGFQTISGVGFRPQLVLVIEQGGTQGAGGIWTKDYGTACKRATVQQKETLGIMGVTADGFTVGPHGDFNETGATYAALCIQDGGEHASGRFFACGIFMGTGEDPEDLVIGFQPQVVMTFANIHGAYRSDQMVGDDARRTILPSTTFTDLIQAFNVDGFEVGAGLPVNDPNSLVHWLAVRNPGGLLDSILAWGSETGLGAVPHTVTGIPFQPHYVQVVTGTNHVRRTELLHSGGSTSQQGSGSNTATGITAITSDGFTGSTQAFSTGAVVNHWFAMVEGADLPLAGEIEFPAAEVSIGLTWVEFLDKANVMHVSSKIDLPDPASYYHGYKEPRVITWGQIVRALSDRAGQYEGGEFTWVWSDTDRVIRTLLGNESTKVFLNRPVTVRMIDDVDRRLQAIPRTVWKGLVRDYKPLSPLHFSVKVNDSLANLFSSENTKAQVPRRLIQRADFPDCPTNVINQPVPIIYGNVADTIGTATPPALTGTASRGAFLDSGFWVAGFGNLTSDAAVPTGVIAAAAAGGTLPADTYGIVVTSVDSSGRESDPAPFYYDQQGSATFAPGVPSVTVDGTQKIQVSWSAAAGASFYRVYLAYYYYGARFTQFIQVTAPTTSCEFTTGPDRTGAGSLSPGATAIQWGQFWYYRVSAVAADGETAMSYPEVTGMNRGYRRPIRIEWLAVTGATEYRVYRRGAGGTWDRRWIVPSSQTFFDDDLLDTGATFIDGAPTASGVVPVTWVGMRADLYGFPWYAFLVAGHAVKEITDVFQGGQLVHPGNFGVTWAVPGKTGFSTYFANTGNPQYTDINGNRYTLLYVRGPDGDSGANDATKKITLNVKGIEDVGDGSGTLISDLLLQYKHAVVNWILQDYRSGAWLTPPLFEDDASLAKVDTASFDTAAAVAAQRISGGYVGGFLIGGNGEIISVRDLVARFNVSADVDSGFNRKSQFFVTMANEAIGVIDTADAVVDVTDVIAGSFDIEDKSGEVFNRIPFQYARDYTGQREGGWGQVDERSDATSISDLDETKSSNTVELHMVRVAGTAVDVVTRRLTRSKEPPRIVKWQTGMAGLSHELGDIVLLTHFEGIGSGGWTNRPVRILRHTTDPDRFTVSIEALDMQRLFTGAFVLGDTGTLPAAYTGATEDQQRYGYLADATTGLFSNGDVGKRLR